MLRSIKAFATAAVAAAGLTFAGTQDASAQGFSLSIGRGGFYGGPGFYGPAYGYGGYGYGRPGYGYGYPAYGYGGYRSSFYGGPVYGYSQTYVSPGFGYGRWDNDWDRGDWRRFNRRMERRFDFDD